MKKIKTIKSNRDFQSVFKKGHSIYGKYIVVYFHPVHHHVLCETRFGFCVGKKFGTAVCRNRVKRLFREAIRFINKKYKIGQGWDIILVARGTIKVITLEMIIFDFEKTLTKARLIE